MASCSHERAFSTWPFVSHARGTELVIAHIEKHICPSIISTDLAGEKKPLHVALVIGEDEYKTFESLTAFAASELEPHRQPSFD